MHHCHAIMLNESLSSVESIQWLPLPLLSYRPVKTSRKATGPGPNDDDEMRVGGHRCLYRASSSCQSSDMWATPQREVKCFNAPPDQWWRTPAREKATMAYGMSSFLLSVPSGAFNGAGRSSPIQSIAPSWIRRSVLLHNGHEDCAARAHVNACPRPDRQ